jgi:xylose isomerase
MASSPKSVSRSGSAASTPPTPLAFKVYEPDRLVLGKRMEEHLRIGVCLWHSFAWDGRDMFGIGTLDRPWLDPAAEPMAAARQKMAVAFEFIEKLGTPYYCFHDRDVAPEGASFAEFRDNLDALTDDALGYQERTGATLLWGTANLFTHPRYQAGAATNPDPEVFAYAAAQVKHMLESRSGSVARTTSCGAAARATTRCSTRTSSARATSSPGSSTSSPSTSTDRVRGHAAHRAEADGADQAPVRLRLGHDPRLPRPQRARGRVPAQHRGEPRDARGHSFHHEVAYAVANGILGSIDANRGDPQNGWDTDQFPNSVEDLALPLYEILRGGGLTTGGFNFDAKLRRQSTSRTDLFHAHVGGIDTLARALLVAADLLSSEACRAARGALRGLERAARPGDPRRHESLASLEAKVASGEIDPRPCRAGRRSSRTSSTAHLGRRARPGRDRRRVR